MFDSVDRRLVALWAVVAVLASVGGGATYGLYTDTEQATARISAADDFTVTADDVELQPERIEADSDGDELTALVTVERADDVDETRFSLRITGTGGRAAAEDADCTPNEEYDCRVTFDRDEALALVDEKPGTYDAVVHGWWVSGRDFEATATLTVTDETTATAGNTETEETCDEAGNTDGDAGDTETDECQAALVLVDGDVPMLAETATRG